ncbi:hypothetical protein FSP39_007723 [Pinctada imbricata]|uniref:Alpha/beta hydrolase fold-5 domain-containing protein n=1 Tax=Pinctada imbricata TaxID=66713 RepID=A0AA88YS93_PINIB|nr:hypothetical protein FSP39_007723 [Pinctada imbricata]
MQKQSSLRLWVVILDDFVKNLVNPIELEEGVSDGIAKLQGLGFPSNGSVFLAGHSLGGMMVSSYARKHTDQLKGALLFSSYLTREHRLKDYPLPVLTLTGDLDGLTRITRILLSFEELSDDVKINVTAKYGTPVIVMIGVNHGLFASGNMPPEVLKYDFFPDVSISYAHQEMANISAAFMEYHVMGNHANSTVVLDDYFESTSALLMPLHKMKSSDSIEDRISHWTNIAQDIIIQIDDESKLNLENEEFDEIPFLKFKPLAGLAEGVCVVTSYTNIVIEPNPFDVTLKPLSPIELQSKMMTQLGVKKLLPNETFGHEKITCKDINKRSLESALLLAAPVTLTRYKLRGRAMNLYDDLNVQTEDEWLLKQLQLEEYNEGLNVTSVRYMNETDGEFYCKLMAPYRALEWVYLDSYQRG